MVWEPAPFLHFLSELFSPKKALKKINALIKFIERDGVMEGIGKPEPLKYRDGYSRMINKQNRVFYDAVDGRLLILSCRDHYED